MVHSTPVGVILGANRLSWPYVGDPIDYHDRKKKKKKQGSYSDPARVKTGPNPNRPWQEAQLAN